MRFDSQLAPVVLELDETEVVAALASATMVDLSPRARHQPWTYSVHR